MAVELNARQNEWNFFLFPFKYWFVSLPAQDIDGQALLLLTLPTVQECMDLKLGPAIKLCHQIERVKVAFYRQYANWSRSSGGGGNSKSPTEQPLSQEGSCVYARRGRVGLALLPGGETLAVWQCGVFWGLPICKKEKEYIYIYFLERLHRKKHKLSNNKVDSGGCLPTRS